MTILSAGRGPGRYAVRGMPPRQAAPGAPYIGVKYSAGARLQPGAGEGFLCRDKIETDIYLL